MGIPTRRTAVILLVGYLVLVAGVVLWPGSVDAGFEAALRPLISWATENGLPWMRYRFFEAGANVLLFVPLGALTTVIIGPRRWWLAALGCAIASLIIEGTQLVLPGRSATPIDVAANSLGAFLGALGVYALASAHRRRDAARENRVGAQRPIPE